MTGVLALFTRCARKERERKGRRRRRKGRENHSPEEFTANPRGTLWLRVQVELQRCLVYLSSTRERVYSPGPARHRTAHRRAAMHVHIHTKNCHSPAPACSTKAISSHCVQPSPFIPFSTACTTTKAEKLGSCVDDRATNLFGGTHYMSSLYSSAAERGELNMDMQRWVSLWGWVHQQCPTITSGIIHTFHMGQMPQPDFAFDLAFSQLMQGHKWIYYLKNVCFVLKPYL